MKFENSIQEFSKAQEVMPGGVNSPVRAFKSVGINPLFIQKAKASHIWDIDNNEYIDCVSSWGPMICGHAHPKVIDAISSAAVKKRMNLIIIYILIFFKLFYNYKKNM